MKEYKTKIVDGYVLIVDDSDIKKGDFAYHHVKGIYNAVIDGAYTNQKKIIAHLPLNNSPILQDLPLLPPLYQEEDVNKLAHDTMINHLTNNNPNGDFVKSTINSDDNKQWWIEGYNKAKEKYKYTEQDLRIAVELAITTGLTVDYFIARHKQPKLPIAFNFEMKQKFEADKSKRKDIKNGVYYEPKTISTPNGEQWVGEWVY